jgi:hypothetical protein
VYNNYDESDNHYHGNDGIEDDDNRDNDDEYID